MCTAEVAVAVGAGRRTRTRENVTAAAQLSDEALLAAVARSDEAALAELYDRFGRMAYGLALRVLRDSALAEDAVQDAFLNVWRSAESFQADRAKASTWVLTFVHRRAVDLVRREERRRTEPEEAAPVPSGPGADEDAERRSPSSTTALAAWRTAWRCGCSETRPWPKTRFRMPSSTSGARPRASSPIARERAHGC